MAVVNREPFPFDHRRRMNPQLAKRAEPRSSAPENGGPVRPARCALETQIWRLIAAILNVMSSIARREPGRSRDSPRTLGQRALLLRCALLGRGLLDRRGRKLKIRPYVLDLDLNALALVAVVVLPAALDELARQRRSASPS